MSDKSKATWQQNILVILGILIVILLTINIVSPKYTSIPILSKLIESSKIPTPTSDTMQIKKDLLAKFYNEVVQAEINKDYEKDYEFYKPSLGNWITKDEYIAYEKARMEKQTIISSELVIHNILIDGNIGTVDRTRTFCMTKACIGKDKVVDHGTRRFTYENGQWMKETDKDPSERTLKAASYIVLKSNSSDLNNLYETYSYGVKKNDVLVHFIAIALDNDLQKLIGAETWVEKSKTDASRPVYNYQPPDINVQAPQVVQQAPVNNRMNCTTNTIGTYTYTNCY